MFGTQYEAIVTQFAFVSIVLGRAIVIATQKRAQWKKVHFLDLSVPRLSHL